MSDPSVLFLVMVATFFNGSKISKLFICRIPQGAFLPSLVLNGPVDLEDDDEDNRRQMPSDGISSHGLWPNELKKAGSIIATFFVQTSLAQTRKAQTPRIDLIMSNTSVCVRIWLNRAVLEIQYVQ